MFKAQTLRVWLILDRSRLAFLLHIADRHRANEIIILPANVNLMVSEQMNHRKCISLGEYSLLSLNEKKNDEGNFIEQFHLKIPD